ncbi:hypothetical protein H920_08921 [Fukomys damarensis]|uniref:Uncharacterized protein n=1 Tax=Fukomys damarensis TaxID=885580 RepID=A0A091E3X6_FUKDA|nr:hypothetical protein H920_08921 [Fukomys damarensis]
MARAGEIGRKNIDVTLEVGKVKVMNNLDQRSQWHQKNKILGKPVVKVNEVMMWEVDLSYHLKRSGTDQKPSVIQRGEKNWLASNQFQSLKVT